MLFDIRHRGVLLNQCKKQLHAHLIIGSSRMEGPLKSPLSVCLSIYQFGIFLRNGSLVFSDFWQDGRYLAYLKTDRALFSNKIYFCPKLGKKGPKQPQNQFFLFEIPSYGAKCCQPIILWDSLKCNISKKSE